MPAGAKIREREVFGPVATLEAFATLEEAIARANDSRYGLQASVFTRDIGAVFQAFEGLEVGGVIVNEAPTLRIDNFPYGGTKASGFGREGMSRRIAFYKMVAIVRGANIVRKELGLPEAVCLAADPRYALADEY